MRIFATFVCFFGVLGVAGCFNPEAPPAVAIGGTSGGGNDPSDRSTSTASSTGPGSSTGGDPGTSAGDGTSSTTQAATAGSTSTTSTGEGSTSSSTGTSGSSSSGDAGSTSIGGGSTTDDGVAPGLLIDRIDVQGVGVSGGGSGTLGFRRISADGLDLGSLGPELGQNLYETIDHSFGLSVALAPGDYFVMDGGEGSNALTRTFTFVYEGDPETMLPQLIDTATITAETSGAMVYSGLNDTEYVRFHFTEDGSVTTASIQSSPVRG